MRSRNLEDLGEQIAGSQVMSGAPDCTSRLPALQRQRISPREKIRQCRAGVPANRLAVEKAMRVEANFLKPINAIWVVQPSSKKYSSSLVGQISATSLRHPGPQEGRFAVVMNVGPGCGGRGSVRDERADAYGKIVWS